MVDRPYSNSIVFVLIAMTVAITWRLLRSADYGLIQRVACSDTLGLSSKSVEEGPVT